MDGSLGNDSGISAIVQAGPGYCPLYSVCRKKVGQGGYSVFHRCAIFVGTVHPRAAGPFYSELQRIMAWLRLEVVIGSAPDGVVPFLPCALTSIAVVLARAADR